MAIEKAVQTGTEVVSSPMLNLDFIYYLIYLFFKWITSPFSTETSTGVNFLNVFKYSSDGSSVVTEYFAFDKLGNPITAVYDKYGNELSSGFDKYGDPIKTLYDISGNPIGTVYDKFGNAIDFPLSKIGELASSTYDTFGNGIGALYDGYSLFTPPHGFSHFGGVSGWFENSFTNPYCLECPSFADLFFGGINTWIYALIALAILALFFLMAKESELSSHESILYDTVYERGAVDKSNQKAARWEKVLSLVKSENQNDWKAAIIDADNLLEEALNENGFAGNTVGEMLKAGNFDTLQSAWTGHKVRNSIAHDPNFILTHRDAKVAVANFGQVFSEFYHL